jgi:transposase
MNNRGIIAKTSTDKRDARRWLIIGAYQAGATTKEMSRMSGVTQSSVRRIVLNFQKTGSPTIPKGLTKRGI